MFNTQNGPNEYIYYCDNKDLSQIHEIGIFVFINLHLLKQVNFYRENDGF
jgi:hypothetical protein